MRKILLLIIPLLLTGCSVDDIIDKTKYAYPDSKDVSVSKEEFDKIKTGMTKNQVWNIIGGKCTLVKTASVNVGYEHKTYTYGCNGNGLAGSHATFVFEEDSLYSMTSSNLK